MEPPGGRDSRFNLGYSMNLLSGETPPEIYGGSLGRPSTSLQQLSPRHTMVSSACGTRGGIKSDVCYDERGIPSQQGMGFEASGVNDINDEPYNSLQAKKSPPSNGKKTKGRVKIKMEYIENKLRRYTTFSKRKTGIMKKTPWPPMHHHTYYERCLTSTRVPSGHGVQLAYELSTLTGTQVMLLVASETGHVYTFATRKLQPMITSEAGKALIQTCLNSPDPPQGSAGGDQRMSATGFEETELTYNISDEDSKENECGSSGEDEDDDYGSDEDDTEPPEKVFIQSEFSQIPKKYPTTSPQDSHKSSDSSCSESRKPIGRKEETLMKPTKDNKMEDPDNATIINQIRQINNALILSNKAKAASATQTNSNSATNIVQPAPVPSIVPTVSSTQVSQPPAHLVSQPPVQIVSQSPAQIVSSPDTSIDQPQVAVQLPGNVKAVPLLVQTANGVGFASVSEGMILGMIQGSSEPKFVAMPLSSITSSGFGVTMPAPTSCSSNNDDVR